MWHSSSCLWLSKSKIVVYANVIMYLDLVFSGERVGKRDHKRKVVRMLINQLRAQLLPIISSYFGWWQLDDFKVPGRFVDAPPSPPQSKRPRKLKASDWGKTFKSKYLYNLVYFENVLLRFRRTTLYFFFSWNHIWNGVLMICAFLTVMTCYLNTYRVIRSGLLDSYLDPLRNCIYF